MTARVIVVAREDSVTRALGERLGRSSAVASCRLVATPAELGDVDLVVYRPALASRRAGGPDLAAAAAVFAGCRAAGVRKFILLSSAAVSAPSHQHPGLVAEERASAARIGNRVSREWAALEEMAADGLGEGMHLIVLRPTAIAARDSEEFLARLLGGRVAFVAAGYDPSVQFLAVEDLAEAVTLAVERVGAAAGPVTVPFPARRHGREPLGTAPPAAPLEVYHVAPAGTVPLRSALRLAGVRRVALPWSLLRLVGNEDQLAWTRYPATVLGARVAGGLGFRARKSSAEAVVGAFGRGGEAPSFDPYGMSPGYIAAYGRTLFRFLHDRFWRIEWRGLENVPRSGRAVLTGVHRGFMPWDGVMALHLLTREIGRTPRFLIHPCLVKPPFLANYMTKLGGIVACQENADWVLSQDELLGMFPEGIHGAFTMYRDAYKLGKFGRDEYVKMALRNRAPIVPFVTVGSAEIYPILGRLDWKWVKRSTEWL